MTTECVQYVIIQATDSYFGFNLLDEVEQACIFALIHTKGTDFINGWMVSKVMPQCVGSYSDWLAFKKQVGKVSSNQLWKIPQSVSCFGYVNSDVEKSNTKTDDSKSDSSEECFTDTSSQKKRKKRFGKPTKFILSSSDEDDESSKKKENPTCDWAVEGRCIPNLIPRRCQFLGGCNKYVHHSCSIEWATDNNIEEGRIGIMCREHHPEYQCYYTEQNSLNDTKWSAHSHSSSRNNDHYKDCSRNTVKGKGGDSLKSVKSHGKKDNVSLINFITKEESRVPPN